MWDNVIGVVKEITISIIFVIKEMFKNCRNNIFVSIICFLCLMISVMIFGMILISSIKMLFTFLFIGFGIFLGIIVLWLRKYIIRVYNMNKVMSYISYPISLIIIMLIVISFKYILFYV